MLVLVDQDTPLADFDGGFAARWAEKHPDRPVVSSEHRKSFHLRDDYPAEYRDDIMEIQTSPGFILGLQPVPGALQALHEMQEAGDDVWILTSPLTRYNNCVGEKFAWVDRHLGSDWVRRVILTKDKTMVRGDVLIDDKPEVTGCLTPTWEHLVFEAGYNVGAPHRRVNWDNWRLVLDQVRLGQQPTSGIDWHGMVDGMAIQGRPASRVHRHWYDGPPR